VGPSHTFLALADAINAAFARWDLSHLHEVELADGRRIGFVDPEPFDDAVTDDQAAVKVAAAVAPGDEFGFVFDFGDRWEHRCRVLPEKVSGWGSIPDQYGRQSAAELELSRDLQPALSRRWQTTAQPSSMNARCSWSSRS
jgi:hypothetical protein